jgi:hypothetical protein
MELAKKLVFEKTVEYMQNTAASKIQKLFRDIVVKMKMK